MVDKDYCCSSYLGLRYIKTGVDFFENMHHITAEVVPMKNRIGIHTAQDIDYNLKNIFAEQKVKCKRLGIMLSGGMDSACLAAYMRGADAYTFRFLGGKFQEEELSRAEYYARTYELKLHYVEISWEDVKNYLPIVMKHKMAPVHSIEPQIYKAVLQAKKDGITHLVFGECADSMFGGLDHMLSKDWDYDEFVQWYLYIDPKQVLIHPVDLDEVFQPFKIGKKIDYIRFMRTIYAEESESSYANVFSSVGGIEYVYPYQRLTMADELDLKRIRSGDTKYLIRDLFRMKYPGYPVPEKNPMPRPVDSYFSNWNGPVRKEFKHGIDIKKYNGNQKWLMWCLEQFLNMFDPE